MKLSFVKHITQCLSVVKTLMTDWPPQSVKVRLHQGYVDH